MHVEQLEVPREQAKEAFDDLKQALKNRAALKKETVYKDLQRLYGHMQHGKKIIDVYAAFKLAGLNEDGQPKLAIVRADSKVVACLCERDGSVRFMHDRGTGRVGSARWRWSGDKSDVRLPIGTYKWRFKEGGDLEFTRDLQTVVPLIPPKILLDEVKVRLHNYHILWEVEHWKPIPPRDPILLKKLTSNMYGVLATWNLTPLERAVIRGNIVG